MHSLLEEKKEAIAALCRQYGVRQLEVFGSAARGDFDPSRSDFDFLVEFEPLPQGKHAEAYFGLLEGLQRLLGRPVDLVVSKAIRNPYFRQAVEETREVIYAA